MTDEFNVIGIIGRYRAPRAFETVKKLVAWLHKQKKKIIVETETAEELDHGDIGTAPYDTLGEKCDLIIVVGGDGSLLRGAKCASNHNIPVLGINHGRLGFLTDIHPEAFEHEIALVLKGDYFEESRFLLSATLKHNDNIIATDEALNDVVLALGPVPHLIQFEIYINDKFVCQQRADGLIIATPTGSTAYALSSGGPILHPELDAIVLVPMLPHTLSSRPIVVKGQDNIRVVISDKNEGPATVSCDGHKRITLEPASSIHVKKKPQHLRIIHPSHYTYFDTLRTKLGWERNL